MKNFKILALIALVLSMTMITSCVGVDSGHKGVEVSWGGETNLNVVHSEGLNSGIHWLFDDMVEYDVREKTLVQKFEFNDKNNMTTGVEFAVDYNYDPTKVNLLHVGISDIDQKIVKTIKSAGKEVVPQYSAVELNITKRAEAEAKLEKILSEEFPEFYIEFKRIQMTDVDIPIKVAKLAEETAVQLGRNELALKKEAEKVALAKAVVAEAKGQFEAAEYDAKRKDILSQPKMLKLLELENDKLRAEGFKQHGKSMYGTNNYFGAGAPYLLKNLK